MTEHDYAFIRNLLREMTGIWLDDGKAYLVESRLLPLLQEHQLDSVSALVRELKLRPSVALKRLVIEAMVTTETSFFRDRRAFSAIQQHVLPQLLETRAAERELTICSMACSSGQEPYSIAMLICEHFAQLLGWKLRIIATDLSKNMLQRAAAGFFTRLEVNRGLPNELLKRYFTEESGGWRINSAIRNMVEFREANLLEAQPARPSADVVLLRNVLIYFEMPTKRSVLERVCRRLKPDGYLIVGGSESLVCLDQQLDQLRCGGTTIYRPLSSAYRPLPVPRPAVP